MTTLHTFSQTKTCTKIFYRFTILLLINIVLTTSGCAIARRKSLQGIELNKNKLKTSINPNHTSSDHKNLPVQLKEQHQRLSPKTSSSILSTPNPNTLTDSALTSVPSSMDNNNSNAEKNADFEQPSTNSDTELYDTIITRISTLQEDLLKLSSWSTESKNLTKTINTTLEELNSFLLNKNLQSSTAQQITAQQINAIQVSKNTLNRTISDITKNLKNKINQEDWKKFTQNLSQLNRQIKKLLSQQDQETTTPPLNYPQVKTKNKTVSLLNRKKINAQSDNS